mmetsp:Transcript_17221/g.19196  ORF Transcript_17221/g.19196 Transcript_17221/m.19196 type:complete len:145 (-) Transcript_17221:171-605(-)
MQFENDIHMPVKVIGNEFKQDPTDMGTGLIVPCSIDGEHWGFYKDMSNILIKHQLGPDLDLAGLCGSPVVVKEPAQPGSPFPFMLTSRFIGVVTGKMVPDFTQQGADKSEIRETLEKVHNTLQVTTAAALHQALIDAEGRTGND